MEEGIHGERIRVAELMAALSLATDLGLGQSLEHCLERPEAFAEELRPMLRELS